METLTDVREQWTGSHPYGVSRLVGISVPGSPLYTRTETTARNRNEVCRQHLRCMVATRSLKGTRSFLVSTILVHPIGLSLPLWHKNSHDAGQASTYSFTLCNLACVLVSSSRHLNSLQLSVTCCWELRAASLTESHSSLLVRSQYLVVLTTPLNPLIHSLLLLHKSSITMSHACSLLFSSLCWPACLFFSSRH